MIAETNLPKIEGKYAKRDLWQTTEETGKEPRWLSGATGARSAALRYPRQALAARVQQRLRKRLGLKGFEARVLDQE